MTIDDQSRLIVILSIQRSGTNLFRRVLGSHPEIDPLFGEIFDPRHKNEPMMFFNYYLSLVSTEPKYALPENRAAAFKTFIDFCSSKIEKNRMVFDIKYNSMFHIDSYFPEHEPVILKLIKLSSYPVIHLIRDDLVSAVFSEIVANRAGIYVIEKDEQKSAFDDRQRISVDTFSFVNQVRHRHNVIQNYRNKLLSYENTTEIIYEDILDGEAIANTPLENVGRLCGLDPSLFSREQPTKKMVSRPVEEAIKNYSDLENDLKKRGVSRFFFKK